MLRHSTAHVLAQAVLDLFPGARYAIGPPIADGFYYDFELPPAWDRPLHRGRPGADRRPHAGDRRRGPALRPGGAGQAGRARALRRPALQAGDHRGGRGHRGRRGRRRLRLPQPPPLAAASASFVDLCRGPHVPHTKRLGAFKLHEGGRRLLAGRREAPDAPADLRHRLAHQEGPRGAPPPPGRGRAARPPQARGGARPDLLPRRARRRAGRVAPQGRHDPQADGGLLPGRARGRPTTSSWSPPTSPRRTCSRPAGTSTSTPTACTPRWRWRGRSTTRSR